MSMDITGIGAGPVADVSATPKSSAPAEAAGETNAAEDSVSVDLQSLAGSPPPEVTAAIDNASKAFDQLASSGQHVAFSQDPSSGALNIELQNQDGSSRTLSAGEVLNLADGSGLD